jgi:hypothetical protein
MNPYAYNQPLPYYGGPPSAAMMQQQQSPYDPRNPMPYYRQPLRPQDVWPFQHPGGGAPDLPDQKKQQQQQQQQQKSLGQGGMSQLGMRMLFPGRGRDTNDTP